MTLFRVSRSACLRLCALAALSTLIAMIVPTAPAFAATPECIAPAKPGGGMEATCKLMKHALHAARPGDDALRVSYLPGGIGAVAWSSVISKRRGGPDSLVVFSGGSLLNLAEGKYGRASVSDVRWVAAVGIDYGMIAVRNDSPYKNLHDLFLAMQRDPDRFTIGGSGTIGSQDWLKMAMIADQAGMDARKLRYVALEGGGEAFTALQANHVQVVSGDASEATQHAGNGEFRVLAVLSDARLTGGLANVPTAREQGFDVTWPIIRGFYMAAGTPDADYRRWVKLFDDAMATDSFARQRAALGLYPFAMTGAALTDYVDKTVKQYAKRSKELSLVR